MAIITLLTDFGLEDAYAGIVKGVILSVSPSATILDISHNIAPQDLVRAAYLIEMSYGYFAPGTVHVVVVDPGVGGSRSIVGVEMKGHRFLAPDNGVLTAVLANGHVDRAVRVENNSYFLDPVSQTFHGRDIFAPVAAHLSLGLDLGELGPVVEPEALVRLPLPKPPAADGLEIAGTVVLVDRFGNLVTNIRERDLTKFMGHTGAHRLTVLIGKRSVTGLSGSYASVGVGEALAIIGSSGHLEIAVNCGNAARDLGAGSGDEVLVKMTASDGNDVLRR